MWSSLIDISGYIIVCVDATDAAPLCKTNNLSIHLQPYKLTIFRKVHRVSIMFGNNQKKTCFWISYQLINCAHISVSYFEESFCSTQGFCVLISWLHWGKHMTEQNLFILLINLLLSWVNWKSSIMDTNISPIMQMHFFWPIITFSTQKRQLFQVGL